MGGENTGCLQPAKPGVTSQTPCPESGKRECEAPTLVQHASSDRPTEGDHGLTQREGSGRGAGHRHPGNSGKLGRVGLPARCPPSPRGPGHLPMASRSRRLPCSGGMAYLREKAGTSELRACGQVDTSIFKQMWGVSFVQRRREGGKGSDYSHQTICLQTCCEKLQTVALKPAILPPGNARVFQYLFERYNVLEQFYLEQTVHSPSQIF